MERILAFHEWLDENDEEIAIELAESGADREMDFNPEEEYEKRYQKYYKEASQSGEL